GGTGPDFIWTATSGDLESIEGTSIKKSYTAPEVTGYYEVNVEDNENETTSADIHVISDRVMITPQAVFLKPGESTVFRALLGSEEYEFSFTGGKIEPVPSHEDRITYTAPGQTGEFYVTVYDTAGNTAKARVVVSGGAEKPPIPKTILHNTKAPTTWPDSDFQPVGAGNVQTGGSTLDIAVDFPNYRQADGTPIPTNYYVAVYAEPLNLWLFWGKNGAVYTDISQIEPLMTRGTDAVYQSLLSAELCNPDIGLPKGNYQIFALAVASGFDPDSNLRLTPDAVFEFWQHQFTFNGCE
ncbi:MAG: hypothetical protein U9P10_05490, partial [Thermodesulfobacteriota bacterium]|nr:hypothetical protein [Thermodesulfobacteriota bacterium]